jgi:hypothetical protein
MCYYVIDGVFGMSFASYLPPSHPVASLAMSEISRHHTPCPSIFNMSPYPSPMPLPPYPATPRTTHAPRRKTDLPSLLNHRPPATHAPLQIRNALHTDAIHALLITGFSFRYLVPSSSPMGFHLSRTPIYARRKGDARFPPSLLDSWQSSVRLNPDPHV